MFTKCHPGVGLGAVGVMAALLLAGPAATAQPSTTTSDDRVEVPAPVDTAPVDAAPVDTAPVDAAPVDAAPVDAAAPAAPVPPADLVAVDNDPASMPEALAFDFVPETPPPQGGLTAELAAERVVKVSPTTRLAGAEAEVADRRAGRAFSVFVPRVELSASYTRLSKVPQFSPLFPVLLNSYALKAIVQVPVSDYFLTLHEQYDRAHRLAAVGELQRQGQWQAIAYQTRKEYYELARAIATRNLAVHRIGQLERFMSEINVLVEGGEISSVHLAQAKTRLAAAVAEARTALANQRVAEQTLRSRLALPPEAPVGVAEPLTKQLPEPPEDLPSLIELAQTERPEAQALVALLAARDHARDVASMARYPTLGVRGEFNYANPNQRYLPPREEFDPSWALTVELSWSPTDMAIHADELDAAELEVARVVEDMRDLHGRIAVEVTSAYENALAAHSAVETAQTAVAAAEETHRIQLALFRAGEGTSRDVLDAELELRAAQLQWVDGALSTHLSRAALAHATGRKNY